MFPISRLIGSQRTPCDKFPLVQRWRISRIPVEERNGKANLTPRTFIVVGSFGVQLEAYSASWPRNHFGPKLVSSSPTAYGLGFPKEGGQFHVRPRTRALSP